MIEEFYVYVYLDPRKPGEYVYNDLKFNYEPFYIGKGKGDRIKRHIYLYKYDNCNNFKYNKINKIKLEKLEPIIFKIYDNLNEDDAFKKEKETILKIGRLKNGPLVNLSDGGEGQSGYIHKEETKLKIINGMKNSEKYQKSIKSEEHKMNLSKALMGHVGHVFSHTDKAKDTIRMSQIGVKNSFYNKTHSDIQKNKWSTERIGTNNNNSVSYIIQCPNGDIIKFIGRKELKQYFQDIYNISGIKISYENLLNKGINKNYILIDKIKIKKRTD